MQKQDHSFIDHYLSSLSQVIDALPREPLGEIVAILRSAQRSGNRIYIFGNGGSAATALHMACDFGKNTRSKEKQDMRAISLSGNMSVFSAYANDEGYDRVFSEPLRSLAEKGDVAIAISGSGNSPNVLEGVKAAHEMGLTTIGLTGYEGGKLKPLVDHCLIVPSDSIERIEDLHLVIDHILTGLLSLPVPKSEKESI